MQGVCLIFAGRRGLDEASARWMSARIPQVSQKIKRAQSLIDEVLGDQSSVDLLSYLLSSDQEFLGHPSLRVLMGAVGCNKCNNKGYIGRTLIQELLIVTEEIRTLIMHRKDSGQIKKKAIEQGMKTFRDHGIQKVLQGITTIEELLSNTQEDL